MMSTEENSSFHECPVVKQFLGVILTHNDDGSLQLYDPHMEIPYAKVFRYCPWCGEPLITPVGDGDDDEL
jgi:hypothetical protein